MTTSPITSEDLSWIDHPANLRANAVLLRVVADQLWLHADEIERLRAKLADIANSMKRDWQDPADHANWCIEHAKT